jgi:hypothetical protein
VEEVRNQVAAVALILAIVIGAGLGYLDGVTGYTRTTSTTTSTATYVRTTTETSTIVGSTTNAGVCVTNINNPPQTQYVSTLHQIMNAPSFIQYSNGRCWIWEGTFEVTGPGYSAQNFVFDHFSNRIIYPCGYPTYAIETRVYVVPSFSGGNVTSISIEPQSPPTGFFCPPMTQTIEPVFLNLVSWNASGQVVSLELQYLSGSNQSLHGLEARIFNSSWSYVFQFSSVNSTHPLQPGASAIQEALFHGAPFRSSVVYDMTATGVYANGARTTSDFKVQLQT